MRITISRSAPTRTSRARTHRNAPLVVAAVAMAAAAAAVAVTDQAAAQPLTYDTGAGLVVTFDSTNGNISSLKHNGDELGAAGYAAGQVDSGWSTATVERRDSGTTSVFTVTHDEVTQFYVLRAGDNTIYMATKVASAHSPLRFIARLNQRLLPNTPPAADTSTTTSTVEGSDVFRHDDGTTASKFYSAQPLVTQRPFGATGPGHGVYLVPGRQELTSGGPFFRDHEVNATGLAVNVTHVLYSDHYQTEPQRFGVHGPYALTITTGAAPRAQSMDWLTSFVPELPGTQARGTVTGTASGDARGLPRTAALRGPTGQYWAGIEGGRFTISGVRAGTYTAVLYAGQLEVGTVDQVSVQPGRSVSVSLTGDVPAPGTIAQIGVLDGTPGGFANADKIERMHPSDVRMSPWELESFDTRTDDAGAFPMAQFKDVDGEFPVTFPLQEVPSGGVVVRIATTGSFAGGRPTISIGDWGSPAADSPPPRTMPGRGPTRGTWRGFNATYTFRVPASVLQVGANEMSIWIASGAGGQGFLSPDVVYDAISIDPA